MTNVVKRDNNVRNRWLSPLFDDFFSFPMASWENSFMPRVDIRETENELNLSFEAPGMKKEDLKVVVENNRLTVSGERKDEFEDSDEQWVHREISTGTFKRSFTLPNSVDPNSVNAEYKDGLLRVKLAKKEEAKPKQIEVNVS